MINLELHWAYIPFGIVVLGLVILIGYIFSSSEGGYDFGTPLFGCGLLMMLLLVVVIFGGIFWW